MKNQVKIMKELDLEKKSKVLRSAILEGINSGIATDFDPDNHLENMRKRKMMKENNLNLSESGFTGFKNLQDTINEEL